MKILIVDDSKFMRNYIKKTLNNIEDLEDITFFEASNGNEAIKVYKSIKPDIVTMDMVLGDISGVKATKEIKEFDKKAKIIMCSSMGQKCMIKEAIMAGIDDYILKPFKDNQLIETVLKLNERLLVN